MGHWGRAIAAFAMAYVIATAIGAVTFTKPVLMWVLTFTLMPLVFSGLAYWYFLGVRPTTSTARREA